MQSLKGKIIFITGASSGIGMASAKMFAKNRANLILVARRIDRIQKLASELKKQYKMDVLTEKLDVRSYSAVKKFVNNLPKKWKKIDILLNNAGLSRGLNKIQDGVLSDWNEMIDTNVKGLLYVSKAVIPLMLKQKKGHIINIGSIAGHEVYTGGNVYCASKHAVDAVTKGMRMDLIDTGIKVSTIDPGLVKTEFSLVRYHGDKKRADNTYNGMIPLKAEDVAESIEFIATRNENVNVAEMIIFPKSQAASSVVYRKS
jgi:3-hydroxy acid dehydrogenase / malonic semialdehyde reductase